MKSRWSLPLAHSAPRRARSFSTAFGERAQGVALSAGVPEDRAPIVTVLEEESTPVNYNDPALAARVKATLRQGAWSANVFSISAGDGQRGLWHLRLEGHKIPTVMFWLGRHGSGEIGRGARGGQVASRAAQQFV